MADSATQGKASRARLTGPSPPRTKMRGQRFAGVRPNATRRSNRRLTRRPFRDGMKFIPETEIYLNRCRCRTAPEVNKSAG